MNQEKLEQVINDAWEIKDDIKTNTTGQIAEAIEGALQGLDDGSFRVAEKSKQGKWIVNQWLKKAVLLSFRIYDNTSISGGPTDPTRGETPWYDKVSPKFAGWNNQHFQDAGFRAVPNCTVRYGAFIGSGVVLMPSFINIGAFVDEGTMVDTWATIGSCAQIGKNCHISGGAGIGGVLEPLQAEPVIIGDNCFIGARSEVAEGVILEDGAVLSMGVFLGASTKIIDRDSGEIMTGRVPENSVVVPGTIAGKIMENGDPGPSLYCAVIVKKVDEKTRARTSINDLLRD